MKRKVAFLLGTGRSGTTLAQRLINLSPEAIIWGEHEGFIQSVSEGYFNLLNSKNIERFSYKNPQKYLPEKIIQNREKICQTQISWMNNFTRSKLRDDFKNFIESVFCNDLPESISCWGFKEIRYGVNINDLSIDMLVDLFPESRNVIITRHPLETIISMVNAWCPDLVDRALNNNQTQELQDLIQNKAIHWSNQNQKLLTYSQRLSDNFLVIKYEEFDRKFKDSVFDFIGIDCPTGIEEVLEHKILQTQTGERADFVKNFTQSIHDEIWKIVEPVASKLGYSSHKSSTSNTAQFSQFSNRKNIIEQYQEIINNKNQPVGIYQKVANQLVKNGNIEEAITLLNQAIERFPEQSRLYRELGVCYHKVNNLTQETTNYDKAFELDSNQPLWAYLSYARLLSDAERFDRVFVILNQLVKLYPDSAEGYALLGVTSLKTGNREDALKYCQQAISIDEQLWFNRDINQVIVDSTVLEEDVRELILTGKNNFLEGWNRERNKIIVDVGANNGDDTEFYLRKGFRCIAVEADPDLCEYIAKRLYKYLKAGQLTIENCAISETEGVVSFYKNSRSEWSSIMYGNKSTTTNSFQEIEVRATTLDSIINPFDDSVYYVKVDIEGADCYAIQSLQKAQVKPCFVSFELNPTYKEMLDNLNQQGYDRFQISRQSAGYLAPQPVPPLEGQYVDIKFTGNMSGCFGLELSNDWMSLEECLQEAQKIYPSKIKAWYDIHAKHSSFKA